MMRNSRLSRVRWFLMLVLLISVFLAGVAVGDAPIKRWKGYATVDVTFEGVLVESDVPAVIIEGRTMIPLRAVATSFGYWIAWDDQTRTVKITKERP